MASPPPRLKLEDHEIVKGVRGWLESPERGAAAGDRVPIVGWAFSTGHRIAGITVAAGGRESAVPYGLRRDDVAAVYPDSAQAAHSGFSGAIELEPSADAVRVEIRATLEHGRAIHLFTRRLASTRPRPPRLFSRAWWRRHAPGAPGREAAAAPFADALERASRSVLATFLATRSRLELPSSATPSVSAIVVVWNRADLTFACLRALAAASVPDLEVVIVDNASTDDTQTLLERVDAVRV